MAKTQDLKNFDFGNVTDVGLVRLENEDYLGYFECINGHVFVVCDGMGGHKGGAVASQMAVDCIRAFLENHYFDLPQDAIVAAVEFANGMIYKKSRDNQDLQGMGTTLVMAIIRNDVVYYAHAGDSRIYVYSDHQLHQLTTDHSYVQKLVNDGTITQEQAEVHPDKNIITKALGFASDIDVEVGESPLYPANGDILLMCTDGVTNMLSESEIIEVLNLNISIQHKAIRLQQFANEKGGLDNIAVQLVWFFNVVNKKSRFVTAQGTKIDKKPDKSVLQNVQESVRQNIVTENIPEKKIDPLVQEQKIQEQEIVVEAKPQVENGQITEDSSPLSFMKEKIDGLNISADKKKKIKFVLIGLAVIFIAYIFWDLFIKQSTSGKLAIVPMADTNQVSSKDTTPAHSLKDTVNQTKSVVQNKPENKSENKLDSRDTTWISYSVKKGDVLGKISTRFGIPVTYIKLKNKLKNDNIAENQKLMIPIKGNYVVRQGDTFDAIGKKYNVLKAAIMRANSIKDDKGIRAGKDLVIPFK